MTRRSTTGMVALCGLHVLKRSSNAQSTIALSTGGHGRPPDFPEYRGVGTVGRFRQVAPGSESGAKETAGHYQTCR